MIREEITRMAREAGFVGFDGDNGPLRRFADLVRADERKEWEKEFAGMGEWACVHLLEARGNT